MNRTDSIADPADGSQLRPPSLATPGRADLCRRSRDRTAQDVPASSMWAVSGSLAERMAAFRCNSTTRSCSPAAGAERFDRASPTPRAWARVPRLCCLAHRVARAGALLLLCSLVRAGAPAQHTRSAPRRHWPVLPLQLLSLRGGAGGVGSGERASADGLGSTSTDIGSPAGVKVRVTSDWRPSPQVDDANLEAAIADLTQQIKKEPDNARLYSTRASLLMRVDRLAEVCSM